MDESFATADQCCGRSTTSKLTSGRTSKFRLDFELSRDIIILPKLLVLRDVQLC